MTSNKLIQIAYHDGVAVVGSREVAEKFGKRHSDVLAKIEGKKRANGANEMGLIAELESAENPAHPLFIRSNFTNAQNGQQYTEYLMTRDGFSLLVMGFTGKEALHWKLKYIEAFNQMEEQIKQNPYNLPLTYKDALSHLLAKVEENERLQAENAKLAPKAEYHDAVLNKSGLICTSTIAKDMGLRSARTLNRMLNEARVIYRDGSGVWKPYADREWLITDGYADYHSYDNPDAVPLLKWTEKGRQWIIDNFAADIDAEMAISK